MSQLKKYGPGFSKTKFSAFSASGAYGFDTGGRSGDPLRPQERTGLKSIKRIKSVGAAYHRGSVSPSHPPAPGSFLGMPKNFSNNS